MQYKATTINGEPHIRPIDKGWEDDLQYELSCDTSIPYIGPAIPDGTILDESEVEIGWEYEDYKAWRPVRFCSDAATPEEWVQQGYKLRQVATLKAKEPEKKIETCKYCECSEFTPHGYCTECGNKRDSEEVEQPMKEPLVFPFSFVEWYSGMSADKIERAWKRYQIEHGYTLTKK